MIGIINFDGETGRLSCRPVPGADIKSVVSHIRAFAPGSSVKMQGGEIQMDSLTAVTLLEARERIQLEWSAAASENVRKFATGYSMRNSALRRLREIESEGSARRLLSDYTGCDRLDEHQVIAVAAMTDPMIDGLCLFDEQGSGKTVMSIHAFDRLREKLDYKALIFAPKNMLPTWKSDFERFMGAAYKVQIVSGSREEKLAALVSPADIYVTNFETADSMEGPLASLANRNNGNMILIVDESFLVKNPAAVRSAAVRRLRNLCDRCWMLCGTPAPNSAVDVVHQFDIADCGVTFSTVSLPKEPTALRATIQDTVDARGLYLRRLKHDVLPELTPKSFESMSIEMEPVQRGLYEETLTGLINDVVAADERGFRQFFSSFLARRMALLQISCNPKLVFPDYAVLPPKQAALDLLLDEVINARGEKVVLWSYFRTTLDQLEERYSSFGAVRLDGSITDISARAHAVESFQHDPATKLFIANPAAAGAGITLTAARIAIYESFPTQTAHFLQSVDRIHRRGQIRDAHYYFLLSKGTLDEIEYERLLEKDRMGFQLFGDEPPEMHTREFFLKELQDALSRIK